MSVQPGDFEYLKRDTADTLIIKAMIEGKTQVTIDQSVNHIGRCKDEVLNEVELLEELTARGFRVGKLYSLRCDEKIYSGIIVRWSDL